MIEDLLHGYAGSLVRDGFGALHQFGGLRRGQFRSFVIDEAGDRICRR